MHGGFTDGPSWILVASLSVAASLVTYGLVGGAIHWLYYVHRRESAAAWKLQPERFLTPSLSRHALILGSANLLVGSLIGGTFVWYLLGGGWTTLELELEPGLASLAWMPVSLVVALMLMDAGLYYSHRALHGRWAFRHVHRWHHRYTAPTLFTTTAMHPVEFLIFQSTLLLPAFVLPMHWSVYLAAILYTYLVGMVDHSGIRVRWPLPFHRGNAFHDEHHVYFHCNFGHHTVLWDRLHGTVRRDDRHYDIETFGGRGAPRAGEPVEPGARPGVAQAGSAQSPPVTTIPVAVPSAADPRPAVAAPDLEEVAHG